MELLGNLFEANHFEDYANTNNTILLAVQLVLFSAGPCLLFQNMDILSTVPLLTILAF